MTRIKGRWYKWTKSEDYQFKYVRACDFSDTHIQEPILIIKSKKKKQLTII